MKTSLKFEQDSQLIGASGTLASPIGVYAKAWGSAERKQMGKYEYSDLITKYG